MSCREPNEYLRVPRTLNEAFGPYAVLSVPERRSWSSALVYTLIGVGIVCAAVVVCLGAI